MDYWKTLKVQPVWPVQKEREGSSRPGQKEREDRIDRLNKMQELKLSYECAITAMVEKCKWQKEVFEKNPEKLLYKMTVDGDTVFHLAASCSSKSQGKKVLEMLINTLGSTNEKMKALRVANKYGNNTLHEVSVSGNQESAEYLVNNFNEPVPEEVWISTSSTDKENYAPQQREGRDSENYALVLQQQEARDSENYALQLLETRNYLGETPLFRAAALGHTDLVKFYASKLPAEKLWKHFPRDDRKSILHIVVVAQHFETALWLLGKYPYLACQKEDEGLTSLQLLAQMPTAFDPHFEKSKWEILIYYCLPADGGDVVTLNQKDDVESGMDSSHPRQSFFRNKLAVVTKAYYSLLDSLAKGTADPQDGIIYKIWKDKKNQKSLKELTHRLVELEDYSWLTDNQDREEKIRTISLGSGKNPEPKPKPKPNKDGDDGGEKGKAATEETKSDKTNGDGGSEIEKEAIKSIKEATNKVYNSSPLLVATITGSVRIVQEILEQHPQAVEHVNYEGHNILHLAIKNRQEKILDIIQNKPTVMSKLNKRIHHNGNTILHQAADRSYYSISLSQNIIGPAMQLQKELGWVQRVKKMLPPHYFIHHNDKDETAEDLFNRWHNDLLKQAQEWVKGTAESCSTVAVLVATVVFAAAYAIPGGFNDENGEPHFRNDPLFLLFTCMDVVAISCSLSSVAFFLSVLSSPVEYPNFVSSIPNKIMTGFILLFFSMATTMLAFAATILLLIRVKKKWTESLLYPVAFFPVPLFGLLQFPMYQSFKIMFQKINAWFFKPLHRFVGFLKWRSRSIWGKIKEY